MKIYLALNNLPRVIWHKITQPTNQPARNKICLKEEMLAIHIYIYIYIYVCVCVCVCVYVCVCVRACVCVCADDDPNYHHHHHHIMPQARISQTLSRYFSPSFIASGRYQGHIPYPDIAAECMFGLVVLLLPGHMWQSIGVHHLWTCLCVFSSVLHVWFV